MSLSDILAKQTHNMVKQLIPENLQNVSAQLAQSAKQVELDIERQRIDLLKTSAGDYYAKCLSADTGALLVVVSGATTGQINLTAVTPKLDTYTPIAGDYVRLISQGLTAEIVDMRVMIDGITDISAGTSVRRQLSRLSRKLDKIKCNDVIISNNMFDKNDAINGYYVNTDGTIKTSTSWYIYKRSVKGGDKYYIWGNCGIYSDTGFISFHSINDAGLVTMPSNATYVILSVQNKQLNQYYMNHESNKGYDAYKAVSELYAIELGIVVDVSGNGDYTSLTRALWSNTGKGYKFIVKPGTYDLITEYKAYFGNDVFDASKFDASNNPIGSSEIYEGLPLNNNFVYMDSGAIVQFNYDGSVVGVVDWFSPFKFASVGGELKGGKIVCSNCRYAIHDDVYSSSVRAKSLMDGIHIYYRSPRNVAIGGGLGQAGDVTLQNCWVDSGTSGYGVFYHNATNGNAANYIKIKDNYFTDSIVIESYGTSTNKSKAIVCGNKAHSVDKAVVGENDNIDMKSWNNVVDIIHDSIVNKYDRLVN